MKSGYLYSRIGVLVALAGLIAFSYFALAGNLEPTAAPGPTMKTLDEIYDKMDNIIPDNGCCEDDPTILPKYEQIAGKARTHMWVDGIPGSCTEQEYEDSIVVVGHCYEGSITVDPISGTITGRPYSGVFTVKKYIDQSSPRLLQSMFTGQDISNIHIRFYMEMPAGTRAEPGDESAAVNYYTIELRHAKVVRHLTYAPNFEEVSFEYERIRWIWENGGIEYEYDKRNVAS